MSIKPSDIIKWALSTNVETRQGGNNKIEPNENLQANGSLDGNLSLNHFNWMMNLIGLWTQFLSEGIIPTDGSGAGLTKDDHFSFIVAFDKTDVSKFLIGNAYKVGEAAADVNVISNDTLDFGTPAEDGNVPISGATAADIVAFSINLKLNS
jgi:hypothetical protein